jgi:hypothetical protein
MRRALLAAAAIVLLAPACGSDGHEAANDGGRDSTGAGGQTGEQALSGTRLKAYWYTGSDGSRQFAQRWYDSMLKADCAFQPGPDGVVRCLPQVSFGNALYSDATCTVAVAVAILKNACTTTPSPWTALSVPDATACNKFSSKYFSVGAAYTGPQFISSPGSAQPCVENTGTNALYASPMYDIFALGTMLDLGMFQSATLAHD